MTPIFKRLAIRAEHVIVLALSVAGGAAIGYLQAHLIDVPSALSNADVAHHMEAGMAYAAVVALIALARQSYLLPPPPAAPSSQASPRGFVQASLAAAVGIVGLALVVLLGGCGSSNQPPAPPSTTARTVATDSVLSLTAGWKIGVQACRAVAVAMQDDSVRLQCEAIFDPARNGLLIAAGMVDAWTDAAQAQIPCALADIAASFQPATALLVRLNVAIPPQVAQGLTFAMALIPQCARDGGADAAPDAPAPAADAGGDAPPPPTVSLLENLNLANTVVRAAGDVK